MIVTPIKTTVLEPHGQDFFDWLLAHLPSLHERDVLAISSKVVAIGEGRYVPVDSIAKQELVAKEADHIIARSDSDSPITIKHHALLGAAGIDESNGNGYYILLPEDPFMSAERIHAACAARFGLTELGIIIVDSRSEPFRLGATGVSIGWWGIEPLEDHRGKPDLFGRSFKYERSNLVDGLAAAATFVMGETNESTPLVRICDLPQLRFTNERTDHRLFVAPEEDRFKELYHRP